MAIDFAPTKSKTFFIGREEQMELFAQVLQGAQPQWIIHVPGAGGNGKTRLLEEFRRYAAQLGKTLVTADLVDFYNAAYQTPFGLLQEITRQLGTEHFRTFVNERQEFNRLLTTEPEPGERQERVNRVTAAFLTDYAALLEEGYQIVWLLDTCEEMHSVESFVLNTLLPRLRELEAEEEESALHRPQTVVVIAGRPEPALAFPMTLTNQVLRLDLPALTPDEVKEFFRAGGMDAALISDEALKQLYARTAGRPLYVALSFDWLVNRVGTLDELLSLKEPFGQTLVGWLLRLNTREKHAILCTALAWRRVEPTLLACLLETSEGEAQLVIEELSRFSFVKYRPPQDSFRSAFQLHDEMRELVNKYVWPQEGTLTRDRLLPQIVAWYEQRIDDPALLAETKLPPDDEARSLVAEWLFYQCQLDLSYAFMVHERLFRNASHYLDLAFCDLLNHELERFSANFTPRQQDDLRFREGLVAFRRERFPEASDIWHSLLRRTDLAEAVRATTLMLLVELEGYSNRYDEALEHAQESEALYQRLRQQASTPAHHALWEAELGQLYNNWGYLYRVRGELARALQFYEKALEYKGRDKNEARTRNNMGYIYFLQGDMVKAKTYAGQALQIRRNLKIPYELGLSYNTMGQFMELGGHLKEAVDLYQKARREFEAARSERGLALLLLNLGRLKRQNNEYEDALPYLQRACAVFAEKKDHDYLVQAFNELGCVYRQRGEGDDYVQAERYLNEALKLSQELGRAATQVENLEDLGLVHFRWALRAQEYGDAAEAQAHIAQAREKAHQVETLARQEGDTYRLAKNERLLGDLDYVEEQYASAFEHYFEACRMMAQAPAEGKHPTAFIQRRYEEMVDRLQEQLHDLRTPGETVYYANQVLDHYTSLSPEEQAKLQLAKDFLDETIRTARPISPVH